MLSMIGIGGGEAGILCIGIIAAIEGVVMQILFLVAIWRIATNTDRIAMVLRRLPMPPMVGQSNKPPMGGMDRPDSPQGSA